MTTPHEDLSRRDALRRGIVGMTALGGLGALLSGCASSGSSTAGLPPVRWPERTDPTRPRELPSYTPRVTKPLDPSPLPGVPADVLPRAAWAKAQPIPARMDRMQPVSKITIHHDGMPPVFLRTRADIASRIDRIRDSHHARGWGDIGYHFVIDPTGQVWEGRPLSWQGAHVASQNEGNLGILVMGNFEEQRPTEQQIAALDRFGRSMMQRFSVPVHRVHTHRELAQTACPGRNLQPHINIARGRGGALYLA